MPQVLKDEVEQRIRSAALDVFAEKGFAAASVAEIARRAAISAGNTYRYFPGKKALFAAVLPAALPRRFLQLLRQRLEAARGQRELDLVSGEAAYPVAARATVDFALEHRREAIILLARAAGTPYDGFTQKVVDLLVAEALRYRQVVSADARIPATLRFDLLEIYRSYVRAWASILERFPDPEQAREALSAFERYHLAGLRALFS